MIALQNVFKTFKTKHGSFEAVKNVNLTIKENSIHGIIGPSGAGKSTLIRLINQLEKHDNGQIKVFGYEDLRRLNKESTRMYLKDVSMIFQRFNLLERKNVLDNVLLPLTFHKKLNDDDYRSAKNLIELVGLSGYEQSFPSQLSGGQLQRVGIARALIMEPKILLCDEPTSALDTQTIKTILKLIKDLKQKLNLTVIIVTHDMNVIKEICDYVTVMDNGEIIENDTLENIIFNPKEEITKILLDTVGFNIEDIISSSDSKNLYLLRFNSDSTETSVISSISKDLAIKINILYANITPHKEGIMLVDIEDKENLNEDILSFTFKKLGVEIKHV